MDNPKVFISYSWTSPEHEEWVLKLAIELNDFGVRIVIDKWDLREGHDAIKFMESMVSDSSISKVIIVSDKKYSEKSNNRTSGVGTEAQIISPEVYANATQTKFVVVVAEKDDLGKAYLPIYYTSKIYIDLSSEDGYAQNFEKLIRWIYDKPLHVRPELGSKPTFLDDGNHLTLGTTPTHTRALEAIRNTRPYALGALDEYLSVFARNLERFRLVRSEEPFDESFVKNIGDFLPYRNQMIQTFIVLAQYLPTEQSIRKVHKFFESVYHYTNTYPASSTSHTSYDLDNYKFLIHELFLYAMAVFIDQGQYKLADYLIRTPYFQSNVTNYGEEKLKSFEDFCRHVGLLDIRDDRLKTRHLDYRAEMIKERNVGTDVEFYKIMQADFVIFIRSWMVGENYHHWHPATLLHAVYNRSPFEIFARAASKSSFDEIKILLGVDKPADLNSVFDKLEATPYTGPRWEFHTIDVRSLLGFDKLATKP